MTLVDRNDPKWDWLVTAWSDGQVRLQTVHNGTADKDMHVSTLKRWMRTGYIDRYDVVDLDPQRHA